NELGAFESGLAAKYMGTIMATVFGGCMTMAVVTISWIKTKDLFGVDIRACPHLALHQINKHAKNNMDL
ncbi:MAG: hypothetical protein RR856_14135, partial [Acinetobacter sp.]